MNKATNISQDNYDNRFLFVLVAAKRALQLQKGARPRLDIGTRKPTVLAMAEVLEDKVEFELPVKAEEKKKSRKKSK